MMFAYKIKSLEKRREMEMETKEDSKTNK